MKDYKVVREIRPRTGSRVQIGYDPDEVKPWRVGYRDAGHYFGNLEAALAYCAGRGLVRYHLIDELAEEITKATCC